MKKVSYDATVKALQAMRAGWAENGIRFAIVGNAINLLDNQHEALACKDAAIAEQARQLKEALAELERVRRERDAAVRDLKIHSSCVTCKYSNGICCKLQDNLCKWEWRGPCTENGGTEDE